ncbi:MAG: hypothetical protein Q9222_004076 [Ikaeria aurantiellina]
MWLIQHDGLYSAPLKALSNNQRVLDVGCGTGIWTIEFAAKHPNAQVVGFDITLPQPKSIVPPNCSFLVADAESDWSFALQKSFDFIHGRMLLSSICDWPGFIKRCYEHLKPGGWLEINDVAHRFFSEDGCSEAVAPVLKWWRVVFQASSRANGISLDDTYKHAQQMRDAGFIDVRERVFKWPVANSADGGSSWTYSQKERKLGALQIWSIPVLVEGMTKAAVQHGDLRDISNEEAYALAEDAKRDMVKQAGEHGYHMHFATFAGQVPS